MWNGITLHLCFLIGYHKFTVAKALQPISCRDSPPILINNTPGIPHCNARASVNLSGTFNCKTVILHEWAIYRRRAKNYWISCCFRSKAWQLIACRIYGWFSIDRRERYTWPLPFAVENCLIYKRIQSNLNDFNPGCLRCLILHRLDPVFLVHFRWWSDRR